MVHNNKIDQFIYKGNIKKDLSINRSQNINMIIIIITKQKPKWLNEIDWVVFVCVVEIAASTDNKSFNVEIGDLKVLSSLSYPETGLRYFILL